jgi:hypothetical protein
MNQHFLQSTRDRALRAGNRVVALRGLKMEQIVMKDEGSE